MRVAITTSGCGLESTVDSRFLAARFVIIYDMTSGKWGCEKFSLWAQQKKHSQKLRISLLEGAGVDTLISGSIDPRSFKELGRRGIKVYEAPASLAREAAEMLASQHLTELPYPDAVDVSRLPRGGVSSEC